MSGFFEPQTEFRGGTPPNCKEWRTNGIGPATWSPIQVRVFTQFAQTILEAEVDAFLARPDLLILGVSPAAMAGSADFGGFAITVLYQERNLPV